MRKRTIRLSLALGLAGLLAGCANLPSLEGRGASVALQDTADTGLGRTLTPHVAQNPGRSGVYPLAIPSDAFATRFLLAAAAERSLDAQYYLWRADETGTFLYEALWRAAERGVRVRLLLDDANTAGLDTTIATLDGHPNIEVRLYNPLLHRSARGVDFITDFARVNRRMHNKAFIVDNQVAVVGGRNIANEYLGAGNAVVFADLDVIAVGPAVREVSSAFDLYWNSASAYPAASIVTTTPAATSAQMRAKFAEARSDPDAGPYLEALRDTPILKGLLAGQIPFEWVAAEVVRDDPVKTLGATGRPDILLLTTLRDEIDGATKSFDLVSPYFVPGDEGTRQIVALARRGVRVRILTNSLAATDVVAVHAGYAKRRRDLLAAGVELFELKTSAAKDDPTEKLRFGISSSSSLHAKTFALDGNRIFVGSFNFDQRSALLNTEMGLIIQSPRLAQQIESNFDDTVPKVAYQVRLTSAGDLEWIDRTPAGEVRFATEPGVSTGKRALVRFLSQLPIEWLL